MKRQKKKREFDLNSLPLLPELIKEIRTFIPKQWILYKKGKYNLKKGDEVKIEKVDYKRLRSEEYYNVPKSRDCVGKIIDVYPSYYKVRFLFQPHTPHLTYYVINKKHIRPANFSDKKKVILNKKNIITLWLQK